VAYWKFNDPDQDGGMFKRHTVAKDSSGKGNDLSLLNPPLRHDVTINQSLSTGAPRALAAAGTGQQGTAQPQPHTLLPTALGNRLPPCIAPAAGAGSAPA
jgi:hypothetical protein